MGNRIVDELESEASDTQAHPQPITRQYLVVVDRVRRPVVVLDHNSVGAVARHLAPARVEQVDGCGARVANNPIAVSDDEHGVLGGVAWHCVENVCAIQQPTPSTVAAQHGRVGVAADRVHVSHDVHGVCVRRDDVGVAGDHIPPA